MSQYTIKTRAQFLAQRAQDVHEFETMRRPQLEAQGFSVVNQTAACGDEIICDRCNGTETAPLIFIDEGINDVVCQTCIVAEVDNR